MNAFSMCARVSALSVAFLSGFGVSASAQDVSLKETVVTAARVAQPLTDVLADVTVLDRSVLDMSGQGSLRDLLAQQPGIQLVTNGGFRSTTGVFLRGASSSQTIVLIDGIRVGSATSGTAALENLPLERIERIEILRGAASALYGPDAVGGVIQIFTREPVEGTQFTANFGAGSAEQRQAAASVRGTADALGYSFGLSREQGRGMSAINTPAASGYNPDEDRFQVESVDAKLTARVSNEHALTLGVLYSKLDYQFDGKPSPNPLKLTALNNDSWAHPVTTNAYLKWDAQWTQAWKSTLTLGSSKDESVNQYYRMSDRAPAGENTFNTGRQQLTWQNDIALGEDMASLIWERRLEKVDSSTAYTVTSRDINSVVGAYSMNRPLWNAMAVVRTDENSQFGRFNNWSLSGGYKLTPGWKAIGSLGTSFQAPTFNQLYYPGYGNAALTPQRNRAKEVGVKYAAPGFNFSGVVYHNSINGFIDAATNKQSSLATLRGLTLATDVVRGNTTYTASYDYADPRSQPGDVRLVRVARNVVNLGIRHRLNDITLFGEWHAATNREDNNIAFTGRDVLAGFNVLNLGGTWKFNRELTLLARMNNVTDRKYQLANTYSTPGRNIFVSLSWAH